MSERHIAEQIKRYLFAKVESLFHMLMDNIEMIGVDEFIDRRFSGGVALLMENGLVRIKEEIPMENLFWYE